MTRKLSTASGDRGRPLAEFLAERLGLGADEAVALVRRGAVYVDRRREEDPARPLGGRHKITVHTDPIPIPDPTPIPIPDLTPSPSTSTSTSTSTIRPDQVVVVWRDAEVLVVDKPAGVPSQATRERSEGALDRSVAALDPGARLLHRIDRGASGLVLFTRTAAARRRFAALLERGGVERRYGAVAHGHLASDEGVLDLSIGPDPADRRRMSAGRGRPAETRYRVLRRGASGGAPVTLLELDLLTGRTHQIRVHLSHAGHPLVGDALYGGAPPRPPTPARLYLHAARLAWPGAAPVLSAVPPAFAELIG